MGYNSLEKLTDNIAAIRIALDWDGQSPLPERERAILERYAGFGGIKAILFPPGTLAEWQDNGVSAADLRLHAAVMELHQLLQEKQSAREYADTLEAIRASSLTAYYTPSFVPRTLFKALHEGGVLPQSLYEPATGVGVFVWEALQQFPKINRVTAVEKDPLTGRILQALAASSNAPVAVHVKGLEEMPESEDGTYDLVVSNIPFGDYGVFDPHEPDKNITHRIHNYFFIRGLDKVADGGILAYITTNAFLNSAGNAYIRHELFKKADFISLSILPDNLFKDNANTEVGTHLLIVQKNESKEDLTNEEELLLKTIQRENEFGAYTVNSYIADKRAEMFVGNATNPGKNQYGKATHNYLQTDGIENIAGPLAVRLQGDIGKRLDLDAYKSAQQRIRDINRGVQQEKTGTGLTYLEMPEEKEKNAADAAQFQLGLFDASPVESANRASAYLTDKDEKQVRTDSARLVSVLKTTDNPDHESIVLITARSRKSSHFLMKLYSNVAEITFPLVWLSGNEVKTELEMLNQKLAGLDNEFTYHGDQSYKQAFLLSGKLTSDVFTAMKAHYTTGTLVLHQGKAGRIRVSAIPGLPVAFDALQTHTDRVAFFEQYTGLRDAYYHLLEPSLEKDEEERRRTGLLAHYERFTSEYGQLNALTNRKLILEDAAFGALVLSSLERRTENGYTGADILYQQVKEADKVAFVEDPKEALAICLNDKGRVDIGMIASLISASEHEAVRRLGHAIYLNPLNGEWETADEFLSGNVLLKLREASAKVIGEEVNPQLIRSLEALKRVQPAKIPFELLDFNLGERWVPTDFYTRYATHLFGTEATVSYLRSVDLFKVETNTAEVIVAKEYAVKCKNGRTLKGHQLLEHALVNTSPTITYEVKNADGTVTRMKDNEAMQLAQDKVESIRVGYVQWLQDLPEADKLLLEDRYHEIYNGYVGRVFDGSHLTFPGTDKKALKLDNNDFYSSQKGAVYRILQNRGGLFDHAVGLGKTYIMILAAMELKRLGMAHKPMILAMKANVGAIADDFKKAYPNARILAPSKTDFTRKNRQRLFHEIKNNNWDCIIISHDQFGMIPQDPVIIQKILSDELFALSIDLHTLATVEERKESKQELKGLAIRKLNLEAKLKAINEVIEKKKDNGIDFNAMGIDHLFVDEAHVFKNLLFSTRHTRVAGLGNQAGSQRSLNMKYAIETLQERFDRDFCVTFLTGTPISNSLTELFLLFKYLMPRRLKEMQMETFDAWAAVFAKKTAEFEFSVTNEIIIKERFRHFIKVPELAALYNEMADYKTADHIQLVKPSMTEVLVNLKPSPDQEAFIQTLLQFVKTGDGRLLGRRWLTPEEDKGRMLIAMNYAKKMAVDLRLIDPVRYADDPFNKVSACAKKVAEIYHESAAYRGTQLVFSDLGTPKPGSFNIYDALKQKLVQEYGIPENEVVFIHDFQGARLKKKFLDNMNAGIFRIAVGSTSMMGTGNNMQERIVASHDLSIPLRPMDLEQRDGRSARTGNWVAKKYHDNKVRKFIYAVERSLDTFNFNLIKNKQIFVSQLKNNELHVRTIDEGSMDEKSGMSFSEYVAILSGDTSLLEKAKLDNEVAHLESLKNLHIRELLSNRTKLHDMIEERVKNERWYDMAKADAACYHNNLSHDKEGTKLNPISLDACQSADPVEIGNYLINLQNSWNNDQSKVLPEKIGKLYGFELFIDPKKESLFLEGAFMFSNTFYAQRPGSDIKYLMTEGKVNADNPKLAARYFLNGIDRVNGLVQSYQERFQKLDRDIPQLQRLVEKAFDKDKELAEKRELSKKMEREITASLQGSKKGHGEDNPVEKVAKDMPVNHSTRPTEVGRTRRYAKSM